MFQISLAAARVNAGYTQADVARILHISKSTVANWEKGRVRIGVPELNALCSLYLIPSDYIFLPQNST